MALEAGSAKDGTGLAGAMADALKEAFGNDFKVKDAAKGIDAMALAIVTYVTENAEVTVPGVTAGVDTATGTIT
jgi:hypothetical protein